MGQREVLLRTLQSGQTVTGTVFASGTRRQQIRILTGVANDIAAQYPLKPTSIALKNFGFNATFMITTQRGRRYGLRINVNSARSRANLRAEASWLEAIANETSVNAPRPIRNRNGRATTSTEAAGRSFDAVMYHWVDGRTVGDRFGRATAAQLGTAMALLHDHALGLRLPRSAEFPVLTSLLWNQPDRLHAAEAPIKTMQLRVIDGVISEITPVLNKVLHADQHRPIHSDLHAGNLLRTAGTLALIDFDDSGIGVPVQDIGVAAFYEDAKPAFLEGLFTGYQSIRSLPDVSDAVIHALMAHRNLVLLNDLLGSQTADMRAMIPKYIRRSVTRLRHYRDTGRFTLTPPGLEPE